MLGTEENLILLANNNEDGHNTHVEAISNWTIYNLKLPSARTLYHDFLELATNYVNDSPKSYANLLAEAHIILRLDRILCSDVNYVSSDETSEKKEIEKLYLESCLLLGDISVT